MNIEEIIDIFTKRSLNIKNNNFIFTGVNNFEFLEKLPTICKLDNTLYDLNIREAINIKIDLNKIKIKDILAYILIYIKNYLKLDNNNEKIEFVSKFDLLKFQGILNNLNVIAQILVYNLDSLTMEEQMLLNELYYFYSEYFNISAFIFEKHMQTHFLTGNRVLDNRENYTLVKVYEPKLILKQKK